MEVKALSEEFGAAAGSEQNFLQMLKRATGGQDYGFMFVTFGKQIRFYNSYRAEFQLASTKTQLNEKIDDSRRSRRAKPTDYDEDEP